MSVQNCFVFKGGNDENPKQEKRRRSKLPPDSLVILRDWFLAHFKDPYPKDDAKAVLSEQTGLSVKQVNTWVCYEEYCISRFVRQSMQFHIVIALSKNSTYVVSLLGKLCSFTREIGLRTTFYVINKKFSSHISGEIAHFAHLAHFAQFDHALNVVVCTTFSKSTEIIAQTVRSTAEARKILTHKKLSKGSCQKELVYSEIHFCTNSTCLPGRLEKF